LLEVYAVGRLLGRVLLGLSAVAALAAIAAAVAITWARRGVRAQRTPLPPAEMAATARESAELPTRVSWINTASQFVPRSALIDPAGDPDAGAWSRMSFPAFVIEWADGRILLVDAGMDGPAARDFGVPIEHVLGADPVEPLVDVAAALGRARERVAGIVFTHLHDDHVQGIESLCRASARPIEAFVAAPQGEHPNYLTRGGLEAVQTSPCLHVTLLPGEPMVDLPGFPGVSVIAAAGHTPGTQLIVAHLGARGARPIVIAGDVVNSTDGIERAVPKPWWYRMLVVPEDDERLDEVRRYLRDLEQRFGATVLVSHDQAALETSGITAFDAPRP
jgi:glyoxylase-like metal-dependent hydrolase (beta-lactamase superfamily II)